MKLKIKSHSIKFRLTPEEMEQLTKDGCVSVTTIIPTSAGEPRKFRYEVAKTSGDTSDLIVGQEGFSLILGVPDYNTLADQSNKAVYLWPQWEDEQGRVQRTVIYAEVDRKHKHHKHKKRHKEHSDEKANTEPVGMPVDQGN